MASSSAGSNAGDAPCDGPSEAELLGRPAGGLRERLFAIVFESDTRAGRIFDLALIAVILASVVVVMLDSVRSIADRWGDVLEVLEWGFTVIFTIEYLTRLACVRRPLLYARSFYGVIDLVALLPTLLAMLVPSLSLLIDIRILRLLRVFRIFKLSHYAAEYRSLGNALGASRRKIMVFLGFVLMVVLIAGTLMYVVEGPDNGYTSIPVSIYWAISTMTTVGFGDIAPKTDLGRLIASLMMLVGWGILAVPTGIVTSEFARQRAAEAADDGGARGGMPLTDTRRRPASAPQEAPACPTCGVGAHGDDAAFCRRCGARLVAAPC